MGVRACSCSCRSRCAVAGEADDKRTTPDGRTTPGGRTTTVSRPTDGGVTVPTEPTPTTTMKPKKPKNPKKPNECSTKFDAVLLGKQRSNEEQ